MAMLRNPANGGRDEAYQRSATVTATFAAVTPRMVKAAQPDSSNESGELVTIGVLSGAGDNQVEKVGHVGTAALGRAAEQGSANASTSAGLKTRQKEVGFPGSRRHCAETISGTRSRSRRRGARFCHSCSYCLL